MTATGTATPSRRRPDGRAGRHARPMPPVWRRNLDHAEIQVPNDTLTSLGFGEGSAGPAEDSEKQDACNIPGSALV
jgi:hypothetical protein